LGPEAPPASLPVSETHRSQQFGDLLSLNSYPNALKTIDFVHSWCTTYSAYSQDWTSISWGAFSRPV